MRKLGSTVFAVVTALALLVPAGAAPAIAASGADTPPDRNVRVLVAGDSVGMTLALGVMAAAKKNHLEVISQWAAQCAAGGKEPTRPRNVSRAFDAVFSSKQKCYPAGTLITHYQPSMVLSIDSGTWSREKILEGHYSDWVDSTLAQMKGARFVWTTMACPERGYPNQEALDRANDDMRTIAAQRPGDMTIIELAEYVCPNDTPVRSLGNVKRLRTDGLHYSVAGSKLVGGWIAAQLSAIAQAAA